MKLRAPAGCASVSHEGRVVKVDDEGAIEIDDASAKIFIAHGFAPWRESAVPQTGDMTRDELIARVMEKTLHLLQTSDTEEIRARLRQFETGGSSQTADEHRTPGAVAEATDDDLAKLNRSALFALLREHGVRVSLPITNVQLRELARRALDRGEKAS
jgi:hypothetical protein